MNTKRRVEIFSVGCPACEETVGLVNSTSCPYCEVSVLDMKDAAVAQRAKALGIRRVPAIVIDGELAGCCSGTGVDEKELRAAGVGQRAS